VPVLQYSSTGLSLGNLLALGQHAAPFDVHGAGNVLFVELRLVACVNHREALPVGRWNLLGKDGGAAVIHELQVVLHGLDRGIVGRGRCHGRKPPAANWRRLRPTGGVILKRGMIVRSLAEFIFNDIIEYARQAVYPGSHPLASNRRCSSSSRALDAPCRTASGWSCWNCWPRPKARSMHLARTMKLPVANVSQHLQQLKQAGLVQARREGRSIIYRLANARVVDLLTQMQAVAQDTLGEVDALVQELPGAERRTGAGAAA
jgi:DNA-binding transcriptional ArsR family regulator